MRALVLLLASLSGCVTYSRYTITDDDERRAPAEASVNGKYQYLIHTFEAPEDVGRYGAYRDYGWWDHTYYKGEGPLRPGYWVYLEPVWYVWEREAAGGFSQPDFTQ